MRGIFKTCEGRETAVYFGVNEDFDPKHNAEDAHKREPQKKVMAKESTKSFVLRVDAATMDALEKWAADEFRSINGQLQWIIAEALRKSGRKPKNPKPSNDK